MLVQTLIKKLLLKIVQIAFTLALTIVLGYCILHMEPVRDFFRGEWGSGIYKRALNSVGGHDLADILGTLTLMWLSMTPSLAIWICVLLTRYLRKRLSIHRPAQP